jgi:hypothetical protein
MPYFRYVCPSRFLYCDYSVFTIFLSKYIIEFTISFPMVFATSILNLKFSFCRPRKDQEGQLYWDMYMSKGNIRRNFFGLEFIFWNKIVICVVVSSFSCMGCCVVLSTYSRIGCWINSFFDAMNSYFVICALCMSPMKFLLSVSKEIRLLFQVIKSPYQTK